MAMQIELAEAVEVAKRASLGVYFFDDVSTVRIDLENPSTFVDVNLDDTASVRFLEAPPKTRSPLYAIFREDAPGNRDGLAQGPLRDSVFCRSRAVLVESPAELQELIVSVCTKGWSVCDDVYVFPAGGEFLLYASHEGSLSLYLRTQGQK